MQIGKPIGVLKQMGAVWHENVFIYLSSHWLYLLSSFSACASTCNSKVLLKPAEVRPGHHGVHPSAIAVGWEAGGGERIPALLGNGLGLIGAWLVSHVSTYWSRQDRLAYESRSKRSPPSFSTSTTNSTSRPDVKPTFLHVSVQNFWTKPPNPAFVK